MPVPVKPIPGPGTATGPPDRPPSVYASRKSRMAGDPMPLQGAPALARSHAAYDPLMQLIKKVFPAIAPPRQSAGYGTMEVNGGT